MQKEMMKKLGAVIIGLLITVALSASTGKLLPFISEYLSVLVGAFAGGLLVKSKQVLVGGAVSVAAVLLQGLVLIFIISGSVRYLSEINTRMLLSWLLYLCIGLVGGYCSHLLRGRVKDVHR